MKRIVTVALAALCAATLFAQGVKDPKAASKTEGATVTLIDSPDGQSEAMIAVENAAMEKTGIKLKVEVVPEDQVNVKFETAQAAHASMYDLFGIDIIDLPKYAAAGWVMPLNEFITPEMEKDILPFAKEGIYYQGKWLGLPWKAEWMSFTYNKKLLKDAGFDHAPASWDDLIRVAVAMKKKGLAEYPMVFTWGAGYEQITSDYAMLVASFGGKLFDDRGNPVFNTGAGVKALQMMYDMMYVHKIVDPAALTIKGGGTRRDLLAGGQGAFAFLWGTPLLVLNDPAQSKLSGQFDIALAPNGGGGPYSLAGPMGMSIASTTKNKEAAWKMLYEIAGPVGEKQLFLKEGSPAGWRSDLADPEVVAKLAKAGGDMMAKQAEYLTVRPALPYYAEWSTGLQQAVHKVLTNKASVQSALDDLAKYAKELKAKFAK